MNTEEKAHKGEGTDRGGCNCGPDMLREMAGMMENCETTQGGKADCASMMRGMPQNMRQTMSRAMRETCCGTATDAKDTQDREAAGQEGCGCGPDTLREAADKMDQTATEQKTNPQCESWLQRMRQACCCPKGGNA